MSDLKSKLVALPRIGAALADTIIPVVEAHYTPQFASILQSVATPKPSAGHADTLRTLQQGTTFTGGGCAGCGVNGCGGKGCPIAAVLG